MQSIYKTFFAFLIALTPFMALAQIDGEFVKPRSGKFLLQNATVHTITKGVLSNTSVLIENGKIAQIGSSIQAADAEIIDCRGMVIYPGMIDSGTTLGLVEVNSVAETVDYQEIGN
ncbi:MAG TPA: amidohydrolase, partial [Algoriphagus sp.]|nr:amidohydrolase [Algoriphagus sp.]